jgi:RNA polymerase sigma-70 factor (ECF subfamily)
MTTPSPRTVAESASSTIDPDAQARRAADGQLSAQFQSDVSPLLEPLYRHAMRMTRNHHDAEDRLEDTLVKAHANLGSFKQGTNLGGWLFRIMTNTYINSYRKNRRHPAHHPSGLITEALRHCRPSLVNGPAFGRRARTEQAGRQHVSGCDVRTA